LAAASEANYSLAASPEEFSITVFNTEVFHHNPESKQDGNPTEVDALFTTVLI